MSVDKKAGNEIPCIVSDHCLPLGTSPARLVTVGTALLPGPLFCGLMDDEDE
jgi:hypothetical protein